jgi:hypothetical protein
VKWSKWSKWTVTIFIVLSAVFVGVAIVFAEPLQQAITETAVMFSVSQDITITSTPYYISGPVVLDAPSDLTAEYITLSDVSLTWVKGMGAVNTEIVVNYDHFPTTRMDGYVAYNGPATSADDMSADPEQCFGNYYISAWSEDGAGNWSQDYFNGEVDMTALVGVLTEWAFIFIWLALIVLSHVMRDIFIKLMVVPASVVLGTYLIGLSKTTINMAFGIVIIIIGVYFLFDTGMDFLRNRREK